MRDPPTVTSLASATARITAPRRLAEMFVANFRQFEDRASEKISAASPL